MSSQHSISEQAIEARPKLLALAYRMLGVVADAEDAVQDAYLRLQQRDGIDSPEAWLIKVTTTICIDRLRQARRRKGYHGPWLPEPVSSEWPGAADDLSELSESLSFAFLTLLESLSPAERAVYLLREAFGYEYDEIGPLIDKSSSNVRQLMTRARGRIQRREKRFETRSDQVEKLANEFFTACQSGDRDRIESLLAEDVVLYSDGGGVVHAAPRPIQGIHRISKLLSVVYPRHVATKQPRVGTVNGQPGLAALLPDRIFSVMSFASSENRIHEIFIVLNPQKLKHWKPLPASSEAGVCFTSEKKEESCKAD